MDTALAIIGFYFTLIGFISGLFFTRLDGWYGSVRQFAGKLEVLIAKPGKRDEFLVARTELKGLSASAPSGSFVTVGVLTFALVILSFFVPVDATALNPWIFTRIPLIVTVLAYWVGGVLLLSKGNNALRTSDDEISEALMG